MTPIEEMTAELRRTNALLVLMDARLARIERVVVDSTYPRYVNGEVVTIYRPPARAAPDGSPVIPIRRSYDPEPYRDAGIPEGEGSL